MLWDTGQSRALLANLLSGLQHEVPALRHRLSLPWRLCKTWVKSEIPTRASPLPLLVVQAFAGYWHELGDPALGTGVLLAFHCLLRPAELFHLRPEHVSCNDRRKTAVISSFSTKGTSRSGAVAEAIVLDDPRLYLLLRLLLQSTSASATLVPYTYAQFYRHLAVCVEHFGLHAFHIRPRSLRRGGATYHFSQSHQLSLTTQRGRWANEATARFYIHSAAAESIEHALKA
eukprot:6478960-Amphidinium_carterae.1